MFSAIRGKDIFYAGVNETILELLKRKQRYRIFFPRKSLWLSNLLDFRKIAGKKNMQEKKNSSVFVFFSFCGKVYTNSNSEDFFFFRHGKKNSIFTD